MNMNKAFFINGGAGRVLCSIPAIEKYADIHDDFIIVAEGWSELFAGNKKLHDKVYDVKHKGLFETHLKDKEIVTPEPYRLNSYFNQKCNLIQAFDIIINELEDIPSTTKTTLELSKREQIDGYTIVNEVKNTRKKENTIVFQPFGSGANIQGNFIFDSSGRSFELADIIKIIESLVKKYNVILMSPFMLPIQKDLGFAHPQNLSLRQWAGVINASDFFLGCDSVGQHMAYALDKPSVVVIGATFPENISYPDYKKFHIIDNGKDRRVYSPIRITMDDLSDRRNEDLMILSDKTRNEIIKTIEEKVKPTLGTIEPDSKSCGCANGTCGTPTKEPLGLTSYSKNPLVKTNPTGAPINKRNETLKK